MKTLNEFKAFILRGNVVDLAIGVVIGLAFGGVVTAFVKDLITPIIGIFGSFYFPGWSFTINGSAFFIGDFLNVVISFLIIAAVVFFFVMRPVNALLQRAKRGEKSADPTTRDCPYCLNSIPLKATRCGFCTAEITTLAAIEQR